jgi:glyoxylase-like metal-dependent hydrolase (beta-lactamase superfamily II)
MPEPLRSVVSPINRVLDAVPGAELVAPGIVRLPGQTSLRELTAASFLVAGDPPLLVDAGMTRPVAEALQALRLPLRLHLTHMHLDHRLHEPLFRSGPISAPAVEADALVDWDAWLDAGGFEGPLRAEVDAWRRRRLPGDLTGEVAGLVDGDSLTGLEFTTVFRLLPGHTAGHSGLEWPDLGAMLVTDYDMEPFGPWYANRTSDLEAYERTLRALMGRSDVTTWITSHRRGVLDPDAFLAGARRYLDMIEDRSARLHDWLIEPAASADLAFRGLCYPEAMLRDSAFLRAFEQRMIDLHLQRLAQSGAAVCDEGQWRRS